MDGTLLDRHQNILPYTHQVLMELQQQGIGLVLASGRDIHSLKKFGERLLIHQYQNSSYICLNGLEIYDHQGQCLYHAHKLDQDDSRQIVAVANKYHIDVVFFFADCLYVLEIAKTGILTQHFLDMNKYYVETFDEIPSELFSDLRKIAFVQTPEIINDMLDRLQERHYDYCRVDPDWLEINPLGVHKGSALKQLSKLYDVSLDEVIAFGNGENDIEMLKAAGIGVAMDNSFETVKSIADDVCDDHEHDGIGKYLMNLSNR